MIGNELIKNHEIGEKFLSTDAQKMGRIGLYHHTINFVEKKLIENVLGKTEGNQLQAAELLGINRNTLRSKIRKLGISI
jgi:two-component system nitrogen regulation response regulator GlnG